MGLEAFKTEPQRVGDKEKFQKPELCPNCGSEGEHLRDTQWKCTTDRDECEVISWLNTNYEIDNANLH